MYGVGVCVYCGDHADTVDHVPPIHYVSRMIGLGLWRQLGSCYTVPACKGCNSLLGGFVGLSILERQKELKVRLRRKYQVLLDGPEWRSSDLQELGCGLRAYVEGLEVTRTWVLARLSFRAKRQVLLSKPELPVRVCSIPSGVNRRNGVKVCSRCQIEKSIIEFRIKRSYVDVCRTCIERCELKLCRQCRVMKSKAEFVSNRSLACKTCYPIG